MAFSSPNIPPEILATLLNLVSFSTFFSFEDIDPLMFSRNDGVNVKFEFKIEAFTCFFIYRIVGESTR